jgi:hypothetical protein
MYLRFLMLYLTIIGACLENNRLLEIMDIVFEPQAHRKLKFNHLTTTTQIFRGFLANIHKEQL